MKNKIDEVLTPSALRSVAENSSYLRGEDYFLRGMVHHLYCDGEQLTAQVHGTRLYRAHIVNIKGLLVGYCTCPVGHEGPFCKHLVALGLAYLNKTASAGTNESAFSWQDFLKNCDKDELIKIILEMSPNNSDVVERYRMANLPTSSNAKLGELKSKVDELFILSEGIGEYNDDWKDDYEEDDGEDEFREQNHLLLEVLKRLVAQKEFVLVWETTTYAIAKFLDCSNAEMDSVQEFVRGLAKHFLHAVHAQIQPNDDVFRLFTEWEKKGQNFGYGVFSVILDGFPVDILDLWAVRALKKWQGYPPRNLGEYEHASERNYIECHLLAWADENKDDKLKLQIMKKKMCSTGDVIELANEYCRQGMQEEVIPLLEKAYKELGGDSAITNLLAEELQKSGKSDQVLELAWNEFKKEPIRDEILKRLQTVASQMNCWTEYYQKALSFLEELDKKENKSNTGSLCHYDTVRQRRVMVLFTHADRLAAWELAKGSNLSEECWLKLAAWRAKKFPQDAADVIKKLLDGALRPTGEDAYQHVVQLLMTYRNYLKMANNEVEFSSCCASIRQGYKRRRLLMEQMTAARL